MYSQNDIFKHTKRKHRKDITTVVKPFEDLKRKYEEILLDIKFIKICKQGNLLPTFVKIRISIKNASEELLWNIKAV